MKINGRSENGRRQKIEKIVSIAIVLLLIATTVGSISSIESLSNAPGYTNNTETKASQPASSHDVFNVVKISDGGFFANRTRCGLLQLSTKADEIPKNYTHALDVEKLTEPSLSKYLRSKINFTSSPKPPISYKSAQILPVSSSSRTLDNPLLGSRSTVTCSFHACGGCNPKSLPDSCTPSCGGTLSGCNSTVSAYYCYEEGNCFSETGCDSGGRDYTKTCECEVGDCPNPDYPNYCGGYCWSDCTDPDYPHWNCKADGTAVCCHKDYPYYCEKLQTCCSSQDFCDRCEYCGDSWYICVNSTDHPTCYDGAFYCCPYNYPFYCNGSCWNTRENPCNGFAILSGVVQDEDEDPIQGAIVKWTYCNDTLVTSDATNSDGVFSFRAPAGSYKLKVTYNEITYLFIVDGTECYYYAPSYGWLLTIFTKTTLHGYIKDLEDNPLAGLTVELRDCSSETLIASDDTNSTGYFSVTADAGHYKIFINVTAGYSIKLVDSEDNDCFLLIGDIDIGTLNINPEPDCSVFNYMCYGPDKNIKLFNCWWDDGCWCYGQECLCGCTDGAPECDPCDVGTIYVDVDNINENYNPQPGARVYLEGEYKGTTDSLGKKSVNAGYGYREVKIECPDGSYCGSQTVYVDGNEYLYFDCECDTQKGDLQVNVDNINGYPVANVYVYVNGEERALTNPFGYAYIEDVPYGVHHLDIRYRITNPDYEGDYQKSLDITVDEPKEVVNFIATLPGQSGLAQSKGDLSNFSRIDNFTPEIAPVAAAMAVIDVASVAWSTDEFCKCVFQEGGFGVQQCVNAIQNCVGDIRTCVAEIRENAGPTADRCKFEEAMLVGDVASPFIPAGIAGHGLAMVVGKSRVLKFVDDIGDAGRVLKTKAGGAVEYVKGGINWAAKWFDDFGFKLGIIHYVSWWDELSQPALNGWNKALKNVDKQTGKELLESLGRSGADRGGKNLAEMSDEAAEWMAKSEIGRKALKEWGDDAQKGLAKIFEKHGEGFVDNLVRRYGDDIVEIVSKGVGREVVDISKVSPEKLAQYVRGVRMLTPPIDDPLEDIGKHQLLKMMKSPHVTTKIVDDEGKVVEVIDRVAVLKKGEHIGPNQGWGWEHIVGEGHHNQIKNAFNLLDNDKAVKDFIAEGLEKGYKNPENPLEIIYEPEGFAKKLKIVLSPDYLGSITTSHPF